MQTGPAPSAKKIVSATEAGFPTADIESDQVPSNKAVQQSSNLKKQEKKTQLKNGIKEPNKDNEQPITNQNKEKSNKISGNSDSESIGST